MNHFSPAQNQEKLVSLSHAGVREGDNWRIEDVSFDIFRGQIVTLVGPNGSGKSTTARLVTENLRADVGTVERAAKLKIGYVPQKLNIDRIMPMSVRRFMRLTGGVSTNEIDEALEKVGIAHLAHRDLQILSGGQFQRAMLARAIARKPDLLVLDEPVQGVDFAGEIALYDLIQNVRNEINCGILLISHDLHVVMAKTDIVICLNGHVCCTGAPESVLASAEYQNLFGPNAAQSLALYQHHHDHSHNDHAHAHGHQHVHAETDSKPEVEGHNHG